MKSKAIVEEDKIEEILRNLASDLFTRLDFTAVLRRIYSGDCETLVEKFGLFGSKRRRKVSSSA